MSLPPWLSSSSIQQTEKNATRKPTQVKKVNNRTPYLAPPRIRIPNSPENFNEGPENFNEGPENFNEGPENFGAAATYVSNNSNLNGPNAFNNMLSVNGSVTGSVNSSPPNNLHNNVVATPVVNKKAATLRLPNGSVNYNAMARQWKANVSSGKIKVAPKSKNTRSLQQQVANLTQSNRNRIERNKAALARAVIKNSSIANKSHFIETVPGYIPKNMRNRFRTNNARNAATKKAQAHQSALSALRGQKGPNVTRHTNTRHKMRKNRKSRKNRN
jgi:hypothetical protein